MRRSGEEVSVNDYLTSYLKNFKTNFNAQFNMIEALSTQVEDLDCLEEKIQKAKESARIINETIDAQESQQSKLNWKLLQRFCLRINEYIEYRISKTKVLVEQSLVQEMSAMCMAMHRVFSEINKGKCPDDQQVSLSGLFLKIGEVENQYLARILKKIVQLLKMGSYHQNNQQVIQKIEKIREHKIGSNIKYQIEKTMPSQSTTSYEKKIDFTRRLHDSHYASKIRSRKSTFERVQNMPSISNPSAIELSQLRPSYANSHLLLRNPEDMTEDSSQSKLIKENRFSKTFGNRIFSLLTDVVQIGNDLTCKYSEESLMRELIENNKVNEAMIQKFRKKSRKIKLKISKNSPYEERDKSNENEGLDFETRHKRSNTLDTSTSKPNVKKQQKFLGFPSLKRKSVKI